MSLSLSRILQRPSIQQAIIAQQAGTALSTANEASTAVAVVSAGPGRVAGMWFGTSGSNVKFAMHFKGDLTMEWWTQSAANAAGDNTWPDSTTTDIDAWFAAYGLKAYEYTFVRSVVMSSLIRLSSSPRRTSTSCEPTRKVSFSIIA